MARILLADDDTAGRDLAARALEADGHQVARAGDGQDALDQLTAAKAPFDLLISDVEMPVLDGIALAERVLNGSKSIKVLLISGFASGIERAEAMRGPRLQALLKPITLDVLKGQVRALVGC
jgi:CheY-like chemotaxis protein